MTEYEQMDDYIEAEDPGFTGNETDAPKGHRWEILCGREPVGIAADYILARNARRFISEPSFVRPVR